MSTSTRLTDWIVGYTLSEPCGYTHAKNSSSIELRTERHVQSNSERITGFDTKVNRESKKKEVLKKANEQARRLTDIITFKGEKRVTHHLTGLNKKIGTNPDKSTLEKVFRGHYSILKNIELDLTDKAIAQKIVKDEGINHRLHHASAAIGAEELELYAYMFTEFFQVIEVEDKNKAKKLPKYYHKYKVLRDAISHRQLNPNNPKQLKSEANKLKKRATSYLKKRM